MGLLISLIFMELLWHTEAHAKVLAKFASAIVNKTMAALAPFELLNKDCA